MMSRLPELLRERAFRRYWSAQTISMFGDQISAVAVPYTGILALHANAAEMGYLTAAIWLPSLLFAVHAGAWADRRGRRRRLMITADLGRAGLLATVPVGAALHVLTLGQLYAVAFGVGSLSVLFTVCDPALFVALVPEDRYLRGQSLVYGSRAFSFVGGPSLGGIGVQLLTAPFAVAADALSYLGSAFFLARIDPAEPPPEAAGHGSLSAGARCPVHRRVPVRRGRDGAGHQHRVDLRRGDPGPAPVPGHRRVPGGQLRHPPAGIAGGRRAGHRDRRPAHAVDRRGRRFDGVCVAAAVGRPAIPDAGR